jgi:4-amino-4-deoxy-L-arabinose transferase-like glycosyltransferase
VSSLTSASSALPYTTAVVGRAVLVVVITYCAWVPLGDVLQYSDRLSVLPNLQTDAEAYYSIGRELFERGTLSVLPPRHPPVWFVVLALVFAIGGVSYVSAKLILWVSLLGLIAGCAWLALRVYGKGAAWTAALVCACSPALHGYVGTVQYEVFTGALLVIVLVMAIRTIEAVNASQALRRAILTGVSGGVLVLTREPFAVVVPLISLWIARRLLPSLQRSTALTVAALVTAIAALPPITWSLVQSLRFGQLITISEKGPIVIELGHNPLANGTYNAPLVGIGQPTGLAFVVQHPGRATVLSVRKILYFWGVLRDGWNVPRPSAVFFWRATTGLVPYELFGAIARGGWLLALFVISLWMLGRDGLRQWWGLAATVLAVMCVHIVTLSSHRFAVSVLPVVFVLISGPVATGAARARRLLRSRLVLASVALLAALMVLMQFQSWPLRRDLQAAALDGVAADNVIDPVASAPVRVADAKRGVRPVVLLTDEYLPRGTIRLHTHVRRLSEAAAGREAAMRVSLVDLDGKPACVRDVAAAELAADHFTPVAIMCQLPHDSVATLAIVSLGTIDFAVEQVTLEWER